jgi:hypothetical protein
MSSYRHRRRWSREAWQDHRRSGGEDHVENVIGIGIEIIDARNALQAVALVENLEFVRELLVAVDCRNIDVARGKRVEVDGREALVLAIGQDVLQRDAVADLQLRANAPP